MDVVLDCFGKLTLYRGKCPECEEELYFGKEQKKCPNCGWLFDELKIIKKYKITSILKRKQTPIGKKRQKIIEDQNNCCFWCKRSFDSFILRKNKISKLQVHIDHISPFAFSQNDSKSNFVASCNICNNFKSDLVFNSEEEIRCYLLNKWDKEINKEKIKIL